MDARGYAVSTSPDSKTIRNGIPGGRPGGIPGGFQLPRIAKPSGTMAADGLVYRFRIVSTSPDSKTIRNDPTGRVRFDAGGVSTSPDSKTIRNKDLPGVMVEVVRAGFNFPG